MKLSKLKFSSPISTYNTLQSSQKALRSLSAVHNLTLSLNAFLFCPNTTPPFCHLVTQNHHCTFWAEIRQFNNFPFLPQKLVLVINRQLCYLSVLNLQWPVLVILWPFCVLHLTFYLYVPVGHLFVIHHYKNRLSSLHIFVHHYTFCASLHVKTSPGACFYTINIIDINSLPI